MDSITEVPIRSLFSGPLTPNFEPQVTKKLVIEQDLIVTPQFSNLSISKISQKFHTPTQQSSQHNFNGGLFIQTPQKGQDDHIKAKQLLATKILDNMQMEQEFSPISPRTPEQKPSASSTTCLTGQKHSSTPKKSYQNSTPVKKSASKSLFKSSNWSIEEEEQISRYFTEYKQLSIIGSGNFGTVYKCQNNFDNQIYAVKCTRKQHVKYQVSIDEAINEAQALAYLNAKGRNQYIVRYFNTWMEGHTQYLVMEHCDYSVTQLQHIKYEKQQQFEEWEVKKILKDITQGLKHLHDQEMVHLDIKPDNLLYSVKENRYKITDLGLSRLTQLRKGEDINEGDARYLAPEILNNLDSYGVGGLSKADIFSLGASIYELMIGEYLPKNGEEWHRIREGITINDFKNNNYKYSAKFKQLICQMMDPSFKLRLSAKQILEHDCIMVKKESYLQWERIRGTLLRNKLTQIQSQLCQRQHSV